MFETESYSVRLSQVDWNDASCVVTYGPLPDNLILSIRAVGLIQPPLLQRKRSGLFRIVCGSRRLAICQKFDVDRLPARVLSQSLSRRTCLRIAVYDNIAQRIMNPVEKSLIIAKLGKFIERSQLITEFMPLLDLEPSAKLLSRYLNLINLEECILASLAQGKLNERIAFALATLNQVDRLALFNFFEEFPFSVSVQEEIIEMTKEIARRENLSSAQVLDSKEIRQLREAQERPLRQRAQQIRRKLQIKHAPRLSARKERFARETRELGLPSGVRLVPPPYFEGPRWSLECTFERADELADRLRAMARLADQPRFQRVMESK
jgi:ParB-like chromosome segregation protein Spo0J